MVKQKVGRTGLTTPLPYQDESSADVFSFSQKDGIEHIANVFKVLKQNALFRESLLQIFLKHISYQADCTEKISKVSFSVQQMIEAIYSAIDSLEAHTDKFPFPKGQRQATGSTLSRG